MLVIKTLCLSLADEVLACTLPFVKTRPLRLAIAESRIKARNLVLPTLPPMERPKTCSALAKRLVSGALGLRLPTSSQDREKEKQLLKEARGNHSYNTGYYHQIHTQQNGILIIQFMKCHKQFLCNSYITFNKLPPMTCRCRPIAENLNAKYFGIIGDEHMTFYNLFHIFKFIINYWCMLTLVPLLAPHLVTN